MSTNETDFGQVYYEEGISKDEQPITNREHVSLGFHKMGEVLPYADRSSDLISGNSSDVGQSTYAAASDHTHNFLVPLILANPTDAAFEDPQSGVMAMTSIAGVRRLWVRLGGAWRYADLT